MRTTNSRNYLKTTSVLFVFGVFAILLGLLNPATESAAAQTNQIQKSGQISTAGVCPPFNLLDEKGQIINPISGENTDAPYSPRKTCGACHDYEKITGGYHFTQGAGENPTLNQAERCQWASTPGNYGGTWCSPAPLYRYLSPKQNTSARTMDMTSFSFITAGCGPCHPGGGSAEFDRNGIRYDEYMQDKNNGMISGGDNNFDGDYYQARWDETGVLEADCMLCHYPGYSFLERKKQLTNFNFRWAPTAAAGWAIVTGSIQDNGPISVKYDKTVFDPDGKISPHIVREPRDNACLTCHAKPGWKKRGANFRSRTDVHIRAGLKCVDCHPAGSKAVDERINEKEMHQFGKGDDPGGHVRDDLDNSGRGCVDCHDTGYLGATIAKHKWLPPLHLDNIACQTCHIPERAVKSAQVQAGDVFNPGTKIPTKGKHLWTFYGPDMNYWNHYGDLEMMGYDDKPTDPFNPVFARYKGKIYPVNRVHSAWPAIEIQGRPGLTQPKMGDIYKMWTTHFEDPSKYPDLSIIQDDNDDGVIEVNRAEEIDALIAAVTSMLKETKYPMEGKHVVWAMDDRVYTSGTEFRTLEIEPWEASAYGNVHKYNHDVYPAKTALGTNGCTDCHSLNSNFFFANVVQYPFDDSGSPIYMKQHRIMDLNGVMMTIGAVRETYFKPTLYIMLLMLCCIFIGYMYKKLVANRKESLPALFTGRFTPFLISAATFIGVLIILLQPETMRYALPSRFWLDANHFIIAAAVLMIAFIYAIQQNRRNFYLIISTTAIALAAGVLILIKLPWIDFLTRISYTIFDIALIIAVIVTIVLSLGDLLSLKMESS